VTLTSLGTAALAWCVFVGVLFAASRVVPGPAREGRAPADGRVRRYRLNGLSTLVLAAVAVAASTAAGLWSPSVLQRLFAPLLVVANAFALAVSLALYLRGRRRAGQAPLRDFFSGVERDPEWLGVDLKMFSYRPSLIGLGLVNVSFAFAQYERYGFVSAAMWLYQAFTLAYIVNYFHFEHGMLFTWDVLEERFGYGLVWGDYVFVPFFYSLPGWYLLDRLEPVGGPSVVASVALYLAGFWLFRGANEQKHRFKLDPTAKIWGAPARALGGRLLVSGFWGIGRKLNYTGELLMYYGWTLPCGFESAVPYLPALWLTLFFPHRAWRDERRCREKYGALWAAYCERVPFRMIPFVY
jgi:delta14-sterol reductase